MFGLKCVKNNYSQQFFIIFGSHLSIPSIPEQLNTSWVLCVRCHTPRYITDASETVIIYESGGSSILNIILYANLG